MPNDNQDAVPDTARPVPTNDESYPFVPFPPMPLSITKHHTLGALYDRIMMHQYALRFGDACINAVRGRTHPSFQARVQPWMMECFGAMIAGDCEERNHRFLEESLELVQACGCSASEAHQLVDYVFARAVGDPHQEVGGVMVTLAALCLANGLDMHEDGEAELTRISVPDTVAKIRAKQAAKPKHSPLPEVIAPKRKRTASRILATVKGWFARPEPAEAWNAGYQAFLDGNRTNPYKPCTPEYRDWECGYYENMLIEKHW